MTEEKAIALCKKHDRRAQKFVFDAWADRMLLLCLRYVKTLADAEEMMQNGFYKFFTNIDRFQYSHEQGVGPWLKKIMVNECLAFMRKGGALPLVSEANAGEVATEGDGLAGMQAAALLKMVMELPAGYRTVFNLYAVEGYSHKDIADLLGITEGTSKSQLARARVMLQQMIKQGEVS